MSNSYINGLLSKSKFAQLARSNQLMSLRTAKPFPTAQTLETTKASFEYRDYGLKSALPPQDKRKRIVVDQMDTIENMIAYERAPGDYYKKLKFNELNIPLKIRNTKPNEGNQLFFGPTVDKITEKDQTDTSKLSEILGIKPDSSDLQKKRILNNLEGQRLNFLKYLAENKPEKYIRIRKGDLKNLRIEQEISEFLLKLNKEESFAPSKSLSKLAQTPATRPIMKATGGLSYKLQGRLDASPNGVSKPGAVVPARLLKSSGSNYHVAVGGFVGQASPTNLGTLLNFANRDKTKHVIQETVPVHVNSAFLQPNGSVQLRVEGIEFRTVRRNQNNNLKIPSRGSGSLKVNEDTIFNLLRGYDKSNTEEI